MARDETEAVLTRTPLESAACCHVLRERKSKAVKVAFDVLKVTISAELLMDKTGGKPAERSESTLAPRSTE